MIIFSFFVQISEGATYGIVPFINKKALGTVAGLVGAGGNAGAGSQQVSFFRAESITTQQGLAIPWGYGYGCSILQRVSPILARSSRRLRKRRLKLHLPTGARLKEEAAV